jgi:hypothetical protein
MKILKNSVYENQICVADIGMMLSSPKAEFKPVYTKVIKAHPGKKSAFGLESMMFGFEVKM